MLGSISNNDPDGVSGTLYPTKNTKQYVLLFVKGIRNDGLRLGNDIRLPGRYEVTQFRRETSKTTGEVLFVSTGANPKPLGASVPLGANSSPVIFRFSYPRSVSIHRPHALTNLCDLKNSIGALPQINFFGGSYSNCEISHAK